MPDSFPTPWQRVFVPIITLFVTAAFTTVGWFLVDWLTNRETLRDVRHSVRDIQRTDHYQWDAINDINADIRGLRDKVNFLHGIRSGDVPRTIQEWQREEQRRKEQAGKEDPQPDP